jgi:signal transduction histidine kinase
MKISRKLVLSFLGLSLLTGVVGGVAILQSRKIAETLTIAEAQHVAEAITVAISHDEHKRSELLGIIPGEELQEFAVLLHRLQNRDLVVVNQQKIIIADVVPENVGTVFKHDEGNEITETLKDGHPRRFLEKSLDYPEGIKLIVVPLKISETETIGAVILEWSSLYDQAIAQSKPTIFIIGLTSLACIILALLLGFTTSKSIANPLQSVTKIAQEVTQTSNFDLQAPVTGDDEIRTLAIAFNDLIDQVKTLIIEKEQRSAELEQAITDLHTTQLQLVQTEKMSSLGQLVSGVAHEINNPVNFIHGNIDHIDTYSQDLLKVIEAYQSHYPNPPQAVQALVEEVELDFLNEDLLKLLESMKMGTNRIRQIVLSLRNFSRLDESEFKAVDLHEGIENTLLILQHRLKAKPELPAIQVIKSYGKLPLVDCYPGQLNQAFMNLLANAVDAVEDALPQRIEEKTGVGRPDLVGTISIATELMAENWVRITIADNGLGIPDSVQSKIFEPFFTTKPVGKGTGLGLSISYQIITEKHQGKMSCDSTPGEGTKFIIQIPVHQPEPSPS